MVKLRKNIKTVSVDLLKEYDKNNKLHPQEQIELLSQAILKFGFTTPLLIDKDNNIIAGHGRLEAGKRVGMEEFPCIIIDDLTETEIKALRIADNRIGELAENDWLNLKEEWFEIKESDSGLEYLTGYTEEDFNIDELLNDNKEVEEDDFEVPDEIKTDIKQGDIIQLGNHRLVCGDSTSKEDVEKLMDGNKADMCFTDPPYNIGFKGSMSNTTKNGKMIKHIGANQRHEEINNDKMSKEEFNNFICLSLKNIKENIAGAYYICFGIQKMEELLVPLRNLGFDWKSIIIWIKNQATLSGKDYKGRYEPIIYGRFNNSFYAQRYLQEDIWEFQRTLKNDLHPTMKPIPLISEALQNSSKQGGSVLDLFGGSGSTLIACQQLNRKCYMMELDPKYCEVICQRWEKLTGKERVKLN